MKILLISPIAKGEKRQVNLHIPQLSLAILAGLTPPHHEVEIIEEAWKKIDFNKSYDLVGITAMTATAPRAYDISFKFRENGIKTVIGGIHATTIPDEATRYADAVVVGEAENIWHTVLDDAEHNRLQKIYYGTRADLSEYPTPRRDLINDKSLIKVAPIETTRGCQWGCDFCTVTKFFGRKPRYRPIEDVIRSIDHIDNKNLVMLDDNIVGNRIYAKKLFKELKPLNRIWGGQATINIVNDAELLHLAYESGCRCLLVGLESVSDAGTNTLKKQLKSKKENQVAVKLMQDAGILMVGCVIFGFDHDQPSIFEETVEFLIESRVAMAQFTILTPYPGTKIFDDLRRENRILTYDWSKYDNKKVLIKPKNMSAEKLIEGYYWAKKTFYKLSSIRLRSKLNKTNPFLSFLYWAMNMGYRKQAMHDYKMGMKAFKSNQKRLFEGMQHSHKLNYYDV